MNVHPVEPGMKGFVAYVRQNEGEDHFVATIRLYQAEATDLANKKGKLVLTETYHFNVTKNDQVNSKSGKKDEDKKNKSFHFKLESKLRDRDGEIVPMSNERRTFLITGTGLREKPKKKPSDKPARNLERTLRLTTFKTEYVDNESADGSTKILMTPDVTFVTKQNGNDSARVDTGCSDYPDDAVLEEEVYSTEDPYPAVPDENDPWLSYEWN